MKIDDTVMMGLWLAGSLLLTLAGSATSILIAVEMQSFGGYLLVASGEGTMKKEGDLTSGLLYFLLGALASAFLVLGFGVVYWGCGSLYSVHILDTLGESGDLVSSIG